MFALYQFHKTSASVNYNGYLVFVRLRNKSGQIGDFLQHNSMFRLPEIKWAGLITNSVQIG